MSTSTQKSTGDVVDLLFAQHQEVKRLFALVQGGHQGREEAFQSLVRLLAAHETAEEEVVYPALRSTGEEGERIAKSRKEEESDAKESLADLEKLGVGGDGFDLKLEAFRQEVLDHAEAEEQEVFPLLRRSLDSEKLNAMRSAVETAERMAPKHPHPHGPESAVGNLVVGPFVAIADRVRDALRGSKK